MNEYEMLENIQAAIVKLLATNPEGKGLHLIGGFRLRIADDSPRVSMDVDYHTEEDFEGKQKDLISLFKRELLPLVKDLYGYEGTVLEAYGPDAETDLVKTVMLSFFVKDFDYSRIEIPVDITRIEVFDEPEPRTINSDVCMTRSDCDIIESKVIALVSSVFVRDRDMVDIFLYESFLAKDSSARIAKKLANLSIDQATLSKRIQKLISLRKVRIDGVQRVIDEQLEKVSADTIADGGGATAVYERVMTILRDKVKLIKDDSQ
jgi:hypothetical protein